MPAAWNEDGPPLCRANPGTERGQASLVALAARTLEEQGHTVERRRGWLYHPGSGFAIVPRAVEAHEAPNGRVSTVTTVQVNHPALAPGGVFEFQHATESKLDDALASGLAQWAEVDFVPLLDALRSKPEACTTLVLEIPAERGRPARKRRAVLGPVRHVRERQPSPPSVEASGDACDTHSFCPCCLLTKSFEAFRGMIEGEGLYCLRLLAMRNPEGAPLSDCRVNGEDFEPGAEAIRAYVRSWPDLGFEMRKQLVVLQTIAD
jgi:hypothetical protein